MVIKDLLARDAFDVAKVLVVSSILMWQFLINGLSRLIDVVNFLSVCINLLGIQVLRLINRRVASFLTSHNGCRCCCRWLVERASLDEV